MSTESKAARAKPSRPAASSSSPKPSSGGGGSRFWVKVQGESVSVEQGSEAPSNEHDEGESLIKLEGPFSSEQQANDRAERLRSRMPSSRQA